MSQTILVPTDYSDAANNALRYAATLADQTSARLILMHAYHVPVPTAEMPVLLITPQELEKENRQRMKKLEKDLAKRTSGKIKVESLICEGFAVDEILLIIKREKIDLVVMGTTGASLLGQMMGSTTTSLIRRTKTPVLAIPGNAKFEKVKKIALACNYNEPVNDTTLSRLKNFVELLGANVLLFDVEKPEYVPMFENTSSGPALEKSMKGIKHDMYYSSSEKITDGISRFAHTHACQWIAMMPHKHSFWESLFHQSSTKQMAFKTDTPLLSIHD